MKQRLFTGWSFRRVIYLVAGSTIIIQSAMMREWPGVFIGGYFASMGLFALGCAAGNCLPTNDHAGNKPINKEIESLDFEEIK